MHIYVGLIILTYYYEHFIGVQFFINNIFWGLQKNEHLFEYEDFVIIFFWGWGGHNWTGFRGHFYAFYVFLEVNVQNMDISGNHKLFKYFFLKVIANI